MVSKVLTIIHNAKSIACFAQQAFEEGGKLYGEKVYLFGCTERK